MNSDFAIKKGVLTRYTGKGGDVIIPDSVTSIGNQAFYWCRSLTSITIPEGVTSIGDEAFLYCHSLKSVTIPEGVTSIGWSAFSGCDSLKSVTIPDGVTNIGDQAFSGCSSLKSVMIPDSVTSIGRSAFYECRTLTSVTIPDGVTSMGDWAFNACFSLADEQGLVIIRDTVFDCKEDATSITIPDSVTSIGRDAFYKHSRLTSITIPNSVTSIGNKAFYECRSLTSITIPNNVTSIGDEAFSCCSSLRSISIPASITSVGRNAFDFSEKIKKLQITTAIKLTKEMFGDTMPTEIYVNDPSKLPNNLKTAAVMGFIQQPEDAGTERGKAHLKYIKANAEKLTVLALDNPALLNIMCENKLLSVDAAEAYLTQAREKQQTEATAMLLDYQQNKLTHTDKERAEKSKEKKADQVFERALTRMENDGIENLTFAVTGDMLSHTGGRLSRTWDYGIRTQDDLKNYLTKHGSRLSASITSKVDLLIVGENADQGKQEKARQLGIEQIDWAAFGKRAGWLVNDIWIYNNEAIDIWDKSTKTNAVIPEGVKSIGNLAFERCSNLTSVTIPDSVKSIGSWAFSDCSSLTSVTIPKGVRSIKEGTFRDCSSLTSVTIPEGVKSIKERAFLGCLGLANEQGLVIVRDTVFDCKEDVTSVTIPDSVTSIGDQAFYKCSNLTSITIPDSVTSIGDWAF